MNKIKSPAVFAVVFITVFALTVCAIAGEVNEPKKAFLDVNTILETWQSNYGNIKGMQVSYTEQVLEKEPSASEPNILNNLVVLYHEDRVEEEGNRYHIRCSEADDGFAKQDNITEEVFDGSTSRKYEGRRKTGTIKSGPSIWRGPAILKTYMLLDFDIAITMGPFGPRIEKQDPNALPRFEEIFRRASIRGYTVTVRPELETVAGKLCHVIEIAKGDMLIDKLWVAHECGMLPLKYEQHNFKNINGIEIEQVAGSNGILYPIKAYRSSDTECFGKIKYELIVYSFVPNVKVDDNTFRLDFPNGTMVTDKVKGTYYVVGDEDKSRKE
jgi:hypothetical protein